MKIKIFGLLVALAVVGGLVVFAAHATGAYFSDTQYGNITGTIGSIHVSLAGSSSSSGSGTQASPYVFSWPNMLPGVPYTQTIDCQNTSAANSEDFWMVFPNATALSALNNLGNYGAVEIRVDGTMVYSNNNLNDKPNNGTSGLPAEVLLASNVGPTASHVVTFSFEYASYMSTQGAAGQTVNFNTYPVPGQVTVVSGDGTGSGLPFQIVATEPNIQPGVAGSKPVDLPF